MNSKLIAPRLEQDYPSPPLDLDSPFVAELLGPLSKILDALEPEWLPLVPTNLLNDVSSEYFYRTREEQIGKSLTQFKKDQGGEECWIEALPGIKALGDMVKRNGGPFVMGKTREFALTFEDREYS
jgi:hypothetical protein